MKRFLYPIILSVSLALALCSILPLAPRTHAQTLFPTIVNLPLPETHIERKVSKDILQKIAGGHGAEFVRVIIQPAANQSVLPVDCALELTGASDIRKLKKTRIATL